MRLADFDYSLPKELIAQEPVCPRDSSRLMVLNRATETIEHRRFRDIVEYLGENDIVVLNNTRVIPARLFGHREFSGGRVEILLSSVIGHPPAGEAGRSSVSAAWEVLLRPSKRVEVGEKILFDGNTRWAEVREKWGSRARVKFNFAIEECLDKLGRMPLPPYIKNCPLKEEERREKYQTVYAVKRGAIAAPTAGLHFTPSFLQNLQQRGVKIHRITLHTGLGTFQRVREVDYTQHRMEKEWYEVPLTTARTLTEDRGKGKRIVAVGTTVVRALETVATDSSVAPCPHDTGTSPYTTNRTGIKPYTTNNRRGVNSRKGWTDLFIYPGYEFKIVDRLITNFHIPRSTLLMLVSAFAGRDFIQRAYQEAIRERYRFYSFGDAMLIL